MSGGSRPKTLFVGIGSPHGDDRIGWLIAETLRIADLPGIEVRQATIPGDLLDWLAGIDRLVVCDACAVAEKSIQFEGVLCRWRWPSSELATLRSASSHGFGLPDVLQLAERLGTLPSETIVFGIAGSCFNAFAEPAPRLAAAQAAIVDCIARELASDCLDSEAAPHA